MRPSRLPITPAILHILHNSWSRHPIDYDTICLWAACCVAFFAFLRSGEFTCSPLTDCYGAVLSSEDVAINSRENPTIVHLTLRNSKTDIFGAGVTIHLGCIGQLLCPVSALLSYLACRPSVYGPLFLLQSGQLLSKQQLISAVRDTLTAAGLDVSRFNGHSFRIGVATTAAQAGLPDSTIQQLGRWRSAAFTRYLRPPVQSIANYSRCLLQQSY